MVARHHEYGSLSSVWLAPPSAYSEEAGDQEIKDGVNLLRLQLEGRIWSDRSAADIFGDGRASPIRLDAIRPHSESSPGHWPRFSHQPMKVQRAEKIDGALQHANPAEAIHGGKH
jgi:hypothetical protein